MDETRKRYAIAVGGLLVLWAVGVPPLQADGIAPTDAGVPGWSADAVWYQILVPRFHNADRSNDPDGSQPWTDDWAKLLPHEQPPLREALFRRRYGGDLEGLRQKLPYLRELGVNTLYLSPVFEAMSDHGYDTIDHRHISDVLGVRDGKRGPTGEGLDPATWQWTASDRLFLDVLADAHAAGFRVVLDGVFNHVGREHWAWQDVVAKGRESACAKWFHVTDWGPPLQWQAWDGPSGYLVEITREGDGLQAEVEAHFFAVVRRWMDPNGDGDPSDGIDGWRLDVAEKVPHGFWRRFRQAVKRINPEAIIVGEIWTDASEWMVGGQFDCVTNYGFSQPLIRFLAQSGGQESAADLADELHTLRRRHTTAQIHAMMNLLGSHDTERAVTMLLDPTRYAESMGGRIPERDLLVPDEDGWVRLKLAALVQFTFPGAPMIYYGDEVGMYGGDDPFCRAPMWWSADAPGYQTGLVRYFRKLCALRRQHTALRRGEFRLILADESRRVLAFTRHHRNERLVTVVNAGLHEATVNLNVQIPGASLKTLIRCNTPEPAQLQPPMTAGADGRASLTLPPLAGILVSIER